MRNRAESGICKETPHSVPRLQGARSNRSVAALVTTSMSPWALRRAILLLAAFYFTESSLVASGSKSCFDESRPNLPRNFLEVMLRLVNFYLDPLIGICELHLRFVT